MVVAVSVARGAVMFRIMSEDDVGAAVAGSVVDTTREEVAARVVDSWDSCGSIVADGDVVAKAKVDEESSSDE